ncbi:MAG TPA: M23 family metallopeptidase [Caulobacteraceae bacterium]|jgi:murein DD-endopeptidase MepM/ murein hydrolase activator NlpD|nr:M23 family metallopeptidase [Caulobacteraceae bacterium]
MPQFDPRPAQARHTPALVSCVVIAASAALGVGAAALLQQKPKAPPTPTVAAMKALEHQAFAEAKARPGLTAPQSVPMKIQSGETFEAAVRRTGVAPEEARTIVKALAQAFDTVHIKAGLAFQAAIAHPRGRGGPAQLIGLSMQTGPASQITLSRTFDGALKLRELEEKVSDETTVAQGTMNGSLYESALKAGANARMVSEAVKLFSHKLDFSRDIHPGDDFTMVFDRKVSESGKTVETGQLLYAEIGVKGQTTKFYRYDAGGHSDFFDELGKNIKGFLLKTPVDAVRVSSGFGMRLHPILGYTRMHPGIDFAAPKGTPVYAAGDGVIEEKKWAGGYGNWLKIRHQGGWETGYGHLSAYAPGLHPGQSVHQGQLVAYVGSTGLSTGAHLHYEVINKGAKIDPRAAKVPSGTILGGRDLVAFKAQRSHIDTLIAQAEARGAQAQKPAVAKLAALSLRPRQDVASTR